MTSTVVMNWIDDVKIEFIIMVWEDISYYLAIFHLMNIYK